MSNNIKFPKVIPRRPYYENEPNGYLESDLDWFENNRHTAIWFLENRDMLKKKFEEMKARIKELENEIYVIKAEY